MTNPNSNTIYTPQTAWMVGAIISLLSLLGGGFLGFYNSVCKDQLAFTQTQQQSLVGEIRHLTQAIQENNHLIKQSVYKERMPRKGKSHE